MKLLPHQTALADTVLNAESKRIILLRGDVGLGKGTALAALATRLLKERPEARTLFLVPAAVRWQFVERLRAEGTQTLLVDRYQFREMLDSTTGGEFWPRGVAVVLSQDFAKQSDILESLTETHWDLVIADEAQGFTGARAQALRRVGASAERIVLATATLPDFQPSVAFPGEDATVVEWRRDRVVDHDGKLLDIAPRPVLHQVPFDLTPAELSLRETVRHLCSVLEGSAAPQDLITQSVWRRLQSSPPAVERVLRRIAEPLVANAALKQSPEFADEESAEDQTNFQSHSFDVEEAARLANIIWVSAKRNYYDPTLDVVEPGTQQFRSLDQIVATILEFHGFENPDEYDRHDQRWLVLELLREEKTLLILDNFETVARTAQDEIVRFFGTEVKRYLKDKPDNFKVLLTSREVIPSGFHQIQLKGLDKRESNLLMERLDQPYRQSAQQPLTEAQRNQLYEVTKGIPLIIKHCYGQFFEYNIPPEIVLKNLASAGNKVVEFSFSEIFRFLKEDELQKKIIILLELANRPTLIRQISDILAVDEADIAPRITNLANFQCIVRSPSDIDDKYSINPDVQLLTAALVHDSISLADEIRHAIARLATEKRIDYSAEEFECFVLFQQYLTNGQLAQAEDFIKERLKERPNSIMFNLHYAKYIKEQKRQPAEAIARLESIRKTSGNDPQVLRLLMMYNIALEPPNFDLGYIFAKELEKYDLNDADITMDIAEFYTEWATNLKMKLDLDPIKEMLRQQKYKELSDHAISLLESCRVKSSHKWHYLLAQCQFNKWDYDAAKLSIGRAIASLPSGSYLNNPYERFRDEIVKKGRYYMRR
jgi:hypothetical protein